MALKIYAIGYAQPTSFGGFLDGTPQVKVFIHDDVAYFKRNGVIHSVMAQRPEGFVLFDFDQAVPFEDTDLDDWYLVDLIKAST